MVVRYGVALEKVDEVEGRSLVFEEHGPHPGRVVIVDADGAENAAVGLASAESGVAAVEEVAHKVFLRAFHGGTEVAATLEVAFHGLHPDGVRVRPAPDGEVDARAVETAVVQRLEKGSGVQIVAVHAPDVVVEHLYGAARHHGLRHGAVDDYPPLVLLVPGVTHDTAPGWRLPGGYRGRRRRGDAGEDRDRVPHRLSPLGDGAKVRRLPVANSSPQDVGPDAVEHEEQRRFWRIVLGVGQVRLILPLRGHSGANPATGRKGGGARLYASQPVGESSRAGRVW